MRRVRHRGAQEILGGDAASPRRRNHSLFARLPGEGVAFRVSARPLRNLARRVNTVNLTQPAAQFLRHESRTALPLAGSRKPVFEFRSKVRPTLQLPSREVHVGLGKE